MPSFTEKIKTTWFKCVETLGQDAANMADSAKQKLGEINMETRRKEVASELPVKLMQLWKDGVELPEELNELLTELNTLDEELAAARAARLAKKAKPAITDGSDAAPADEKVEEAVETAEEMINEAVATAEEELTEVVDAAEEMIAEAVETANQPTEENQY
ncbi:MAG: hypothetical protein J6A48_07165 [Clostridia bacterium]|nr:hypothetical protein [Clostridia bacterium]